MATNATAAFTDALRESGLLEEEQLRELAQSIVPRFATLEALAEELVRRGWLTSYQADQLLQGQGAKLVLGQYTLLERLGEGGMGQVFKARHRLLKRVVALKVIHPDWLTNRNAVHRFHREIEAVGALSHPNMVTAHDADHVGNTHFLVMEYVDGVDLATLVHRQGPLPAGRACEYIRQAALGLQHAYERGLVHRDIKPSNLLVTRSAERGTRSEDGSALRAPSSALVKILDMGLARLHTPDEEEEASSTTALTQEGAVMGTADYISPEQATNARRVDIRADLYSLGCTFYFLLTGQPPFPGGNFMEKLFKHKLDAPRSVRATRADVPPEVAAVVLKLMAKRPEDRYQTPAELAAELAPFGEVPDDAPALKSPAGDLLAAGKATPTPDRGGETRNADRGLVMPASDVSAPSVAFQVGPSLGATQRDSSVDEKAPRATQATIALEGARVDAPVLPPADLVTPRPRNHLLLAGMALLGAAVVGLAFAFVYRGYQPTGPLAKGTPPEEPPPAVTPKDDAKEKDREIAKKDDAIPRDKDAAAKDKVQVERPPEFHGPPAPPAPAAPPKPNVGMLYRVNARTPLTSAVFTADGKRILLGTNDTVAEYDLKSLHPDSKPLSSLRYPHAQVLVNRPPLLVAPSPTGSKVLLGTVDRVIEVGQVRPARPLVALWEVDSADLPRVFHGPRSPINCVALAPTGPPRALSGLQDGTIVLWDLEEQERPVLRVLNKHTDMVEAIAYSPDARRALSGSRDRTLCLWNAEDGRHLHTFTGHERWVTCVTFSADGEQALSGSVDQTARLWSLKDPPKPALVLKGHHGPLTCVALSPDGCYALTGSEDMTVRYWELKGERQMASFKHDGAVLAVAFSPDGRYALSVGKDQTVCRWELPE